jgi:hypothetical protein
VLLDATGIRHPDLAQTNAAFADAEACDYIVMGTRGRSRLAQLLLGSKVSQDPAAIDQVEALGNLARWCLTLGQAANVRAA